MKHSTRCFLNVLLSASLVLLPQTLLPKIKSNPIHILKTTTNNNYTAVTINNLFNYYSNNGDGSFNPYWSGFNEGLEYPKGSGKTTVFEEGIVWGGIHNGTLKVGGSTYWHGLQAGRIITPGATPVADDPTSATNHVYRVRLDVNPNTPFDDAMNAKLTASEAEVMQYQGLTAQQIYNQYISDWNNWPASSGAPFTDVNQNDVYDPSVDIPGYPGADQTLWYVANDLDASAVNTFSGSSPIGLEMQRTIWAYNQYGPMGNTIFTRTRLINKSGYSVDQMYLAQWADPDLGDASDDFVGCDTVLNMGYVYNGNPIDAVYGAAPPAVGYRMLIGPNIPGTGSDRGYRNGVLQYGYKNLAMTAFVPFINGSSSFTDPANGTNGTAQWYNSLQGLTTSGNSYTNPTTGRVTTYVVSGDPVTYNGWIDGSIAPPADRRLAFSSGPFSLAVGDTQEIVIASIVGQGTDRLSSITSLRSSSNLVQAFTNGAAVPGIAPVPSPVVLGTVLPLHGSIANPGTSSATGQWLIVSKPSNSTAAIQVLGTGEATFTPDANGTFTIGYQAIVSSSVTGEYDVTFNVQDTLFIAAPLNLAATAGNGQVTLQWNKNTEMNFLKYRIYRGTASGTEILSDSSSNSITDTTKVVTGLSNGTMYYFRITGVNKSWIESGFSNEVSVTPRNPGTTFFQPVNNLGITDNVGQFGSAWGDYDGDGYLDLFHSGANVPSVLYKNTGTGFTKVSFADDSTQTCGAVWADFDGDGKLDLLFTNGTGLKLYKGNGGGQFTDITSASNLNNFSVSTGALLMMASVADYNRDGNLDIVFAGGNDAPGPIRLLKNNGGVFTDVASTVLSSNGSFVSWNPAWVDVNNDGKLDLWIPTILTPGQSCALYINQGNTLVLSNPSTTGLNAPSAVTSAWGDYDNDGYMDLFLIPYSSDGAGVAKLYHNNGNGTFTDVAHSMGLDSAFTDARTVCWGDYDNDGRLDLLITRKHNQQQLWHNTGSGFVEVGSQAGINIPGGAFQSGMFVDYNNDGFMDIFLGGASTVLFQNNGGNGNNWIGIKPVGAGNNKSAIGARITTYTGALKQIRDIQGGGVGGETNGNIWANFGLGTATKVDSAIVRWPDGAIETFKNLTIDTYNTINQGIFAPATPQNLTATVGNGQVTLMWNKNTGADFLRYRIYRGTASGAEILSDSSSNSISDTTKVVTGLSNGTVYYFRITALNNSLTESGYGNEVSAMPSRPMMDYISETRGDTLVIKTQAEMGGDANALYLVLQLDNVNVPAGRVYMLKAGGVYPLQNYPTTYANRTTRIVGSDPTPLVNNKNAASSLPLICGNIGSGTYPGGINAGGNLEVRNCALECAANDGTEGWAFTATSAANIHITYDNCLFEHTLWTELAGSTNNNGCSFFVSNCYFVNLNGQPCRRNGGVYDGFVNMDTMWVENCTHIMTQGSMYKWRNYTAQRININHNTFVNCAGSQFMDLGTQVNVNYTNNLFVNCNVQPSSPVLASADQGEIDLDLQPMGFVNVYPDSTLEANHTPRKFLVEGNNLFWSPYLSNVVDTCNQIRRDGKTGWQSQMILMNTRTKAMFNNNTQYPYLTEGKQYAVDPQFTNPRNLFGDQLANLKTFAVSTVDTSNNNWAVLPDWRLVNTGSSNYVYFDWPIPVDLSYNNATLLTGATNGFPVGDINWFPTQKAQWLAQRTAEYTAIQNALNNGTTTISNIILPPPTSWNFASITGKNASIAVPTSINPRIGCQSLQTGDAVGVFFVRNDSLICGGYSIWQAGQNMAITAWGDNTQTTLKDGFADGELIQFKIWDSQAGREYNATAQYSTGGTTYTTNGIYALSSLVGISSIYHSISLPQGWNMISSFVAPKDSTIDTLFSKVKNHIVLMKDGFGMVYWPSMSINNIGKWNPENGYQIYMQTSDTLTMFGNEINPQQTPMALSQGWSMVSYLRNSPMRSDSALVSLGSNVVIAKNGAGQVYWPSLSVNTIGNMRPGQGYQMYLSGAGTLTYPANVTSAPPSMLTKTPNLLATTSDQAPKHYKVNAVNTGSNAIVLVKTQDAKDGDEVAVLNASKVVIGSGVVKSGQAAVTVWGDNTLTPDVVEGAKEGEELSLTLWTNADQTEKNLTVTALTDALVNKDGGTDLKYKENQVLIATTNIVANNIPKEFLLCQNYPNPFNPTTTLEFGVPVDSKVKVEVYNILGQLIAVLVDEVRQAGYYKVTFGSQSMPSGVYFYRMTAGSFVQTKKMQLIK